MQPEVVDRFRAAMSRLAAGVVMVTCHVGDKPWGLTVSACCSVSMDPPLLLVSLGGETASARAIGETGRFGVALLGDHLLDVARFGSLRGNAKFVEDYCRPEQQGSTPSAWRASTPTCAATSTRGAWPAGRCTSPAAARRCARRCGRSGWR